MTDEPKSTATQLADISECMARARELAEGVRKNAETSGFATPVVDAMALQAYQIALNKELDAYHDATCKSCRQHESKRARLWPALGYLAVVLGYVGLGIASARAGDSSSAMVMGWCAGLMTTLAVHRSVVWWGDRAR
jgi:hypothetical protein